MPSGVRRRRSARSGASRRPDDDARTRPPSSESGALVGFAIPAEGAGFQDTIKLIYGFDAASHRVVGMGVLESRETPGLGDKIAKDADFLASFRDLRRGPRDRRGRVRAQQQQRGGRHQRRHHLDG